MNFVPCVTWVKKGVAKEIPLKVQLTKDELQRLIEEARKELGETDLNDDDIDIKKEVLDEEDEFNKRYDLETYDDDEGVDVPLTSISHLTVYAKNEDDPLMTLQDEGDGSDEEEDFRIRPSDNLIAVGHVENDSSNLEIYVYNEEDGHLYVHHDIVLPAFPMALEWLSFDPSEDNPGCNNYVAIGDMTSVIRIWDLDLVNVLEPSYKLGKKSKKEDGGQRSHSGHTDAVLSLSWNEHVRHILASGSADQTVALWDLNSSLVSSALSHHSDRVQTLEFHPFESSMLLSGSCDGSTVLTDCRTPEHGKKWTFGAEVEKVLWNHFDAFYYLVATEDGMVHYVDVRMAEKVFEIKAHHRVVTGIALSPQCPGCLVTVSSDRTLKMWDIVDNSRAEFIMERKPKLGALYCLEACPDYPFVVAMGGDKRSDNFKVWDIRQSAAARKQFAQRPLQKTSPRSGEPAVDSRGVVPMEEEDEIRSAAANGAIGKKKKKKKKKKKLH